MCKEKVEEAFQSFEDCVNESTQGLKNTFKVTKKDK